MATAHYKGNADILYTPLGGTAAVHTLAIPVLISPQQGFTLRSRSRRWESWNADRTEREVFTVGDPVHEMEGWIRMDNEPASLEAMFEEALNNDVTLKYRPDGSTEYPLKILSAGGDNGEIVITPDTERFAFGEWQCRFMARRVDGGDLSGLL